VAYLILVRHGRSEWNDKGLWTGWKDIPLNDEGRAEAIRTAEALADIKIDLAFVPPQQRSKETLTIILDKLGATPPVTEIKAFMERDYGDYTGKNKWQVKEEIGEEEFMKLRRGWDYPIPHGESLKQVYERSVPYFEYEVLPELRAGKNIIIASSGNCLRSLVKYLEHVSDADIASIEISTGEAWVYQLDGSGSVISKEMRAKNEKHV